MKRIYKAVALAAAVTTSVTMSGCVTSDYGNKQLGGTLLGAGAGGLVGAQFGSGTGKLAATGAGTLIGALVGGGRRTQPGQGGRALCEPSGASGP